MVVSMANWFPAQRGKPFAMTSIRRLSMRWTVEMLVESLEVLPGNVAQKWLGCMLTPYGSEQKSLDLQYHRQQAAKVYHANKWILEGRRVPISQRLRYFDSVVSSVACFVGGHRTIYQEHLHTLDILFFFLTPFCRDRVSRSCFTGQLPDIHFRKFCRPIVGPPPYIDWILAWHEILHTWNERAAHFVRVAKIESWSQMCCGSYWKLASLVVQRPTHHWIRRVLHWQPVGQRRLGRPKLCWEGKLEMYCRYQGLVHWEMAAQNCELWKQHFNRF